MDLQEIFSSQTKSIRAILMDAGWDYTNEGLTKQVFENKVVIQFTIKVLKYREQVKPVTDDGGGMVRNVIVPWIGLKIFSEDMSERIMFAVKSDISRAGIGLFKDTEAQLEVFDTESTAYCNLQYPSGWSDKGVL